MVQPRAERVREALRDTRSFASTLKQLIFVEVFCTLAAMSTGVGMGFLAKESKFWVFFAALQWGLLACEIVCLGLLKAFLVLHVLKMIMGLVLSSIKLSLAAVSLATSALVLLPHALLSAFILLTAVILYPVKLTASACFHVAFALWTLLYLSLTTAGFLAAFLGHATSMICWHTSKALSTGICLLCRIVIGTATRLVLRSASILLATARAAFLLCVTASTALSLWFRSIVLAFVAFVRWMAASSLAAVLCLHCTAGSAIAAFRRAVADLRLFRRPIPASTEDSQQIAPDQEEVITHLSRTAKRRARRAKQASDSTLVLSNLESEGDPESLENLLQLGKWAVQGTWRSTMDAMDTPDDEDV